MAWTSPATFSAGATLTAAQLNSNLRDNLNAAFPGGTTFSTWSPSYANLTIGNGTVVARYIQIGSLVTAHFTFTLGSTSAVGTAPTVSTPVTAASGYTAGQNVVGNVRFADTGTAAFTGIVQLTTTTTFGIISLLASGTPLQNTSVSATVPHTWATSDVLAFQAVYEAA